MQQSISAQEMPKFSCLTKSEALLSLERVVKETTEAIDNGDTMSFISNHYTNGNYRIHIVISEKK